MHRYRRIDADFTANILVLGVYVSLVFRQGSLPQGTLAKSLPPLSNAGALGQEMTPNWWLGRVGVACSDGNNKKGRCWSRLLHPKPFRSPQPVCGSRTRLVEGGAERGQRARKAGRAGRTLGKSQQARRGDRQPL